MACVAGYLACCGDVNKLAKIAECHPILCKPFTVFISEDIINRESIGGVFTFLDAW